MPLFPPFQTIIRFLSKLFFIDFSSTSSALPPLEQQTLASEITFMAQAMKAFYSKCRYFPCSSMNLDDYEFVPLFEPLIPLRQYRCLSIPLFYSYQLQAVQWFTLLYLFNYHGILGDEMGLGKTYVTLYSIYYTTLYSFLLHLIQ